jgi:hypothetical protein
LTVEVFNAEFLRGCILPFIRLYTITFTKADIAQARTINPFIPKDLTEYIVAAYLYRFKLILLFLFTILAMYQCGQMKTSLRVPLTQQHARF